MTPSQLPPTHGPVSRGFLFALLVVCGMLAAAPALSASRAASVTAGDAHTCVLGTAGGVRCWGDNYYGQLGDGSWIDRTTPVQVAGLPNAVSAVAAGGTHTCYLMGGVLKCWGNTYSYTPTDVVGLVGEAVGVAAGLGHTCAVMSNGGVRCWGSNLYGQLGDGTETSRTTPANVVGLAGGVAVLAMGDYHTCALGTAGWVQCWGYNLYGQLGDGTTATSSPTPTDVVGLASGVVAVAAGSNHTCAVTTGGGVKCWGANWANQLGIGTNNFPNTPTDVTGLASGVASVAAGDSHTCALTTSGGAKCWGNNYHGQVGDGT
jgi:alpha-tubulin suppressor-like RCC1 family protein